jgi:uncharacterized protein (DUF608 family)
MPTDQSILDLQKEIKVKYFSQLCTQDLETSSLPHQIVMELVRNQIVPYTAKVFVEMLCEEARTFKGTI